MQKPGPEKTLEKIKNEIIETANDLAKDWSALLFIMIGDEEDLGFEFHVYKKSGEMLQIDLENEELFDWIEEYQEKSWVPGQRPWIVAALRIINPSLETKVDFEFNNIDKWEELPTHQQVLNLSQNI